MAQDNTTGGQTGVDGRTAGTPRSSAAQAYIDEGPPGDMLSSGGGGR